MDSSISIIIPLYNGEGFIGQTLDSLASQTSPPDEVIVVDNGSTDAGADEARAHGIHPTVVTMNNYGVAAARNYGAFLARSRWVAFVDQDDLWHPLRVEALATVAELNPGVEALATRELGFAVEQDRGQLAGHERFRMVDYWVETADAAEIVAKLRHSVSLSDMKVTSIAAEDFLWDSQFATTSVCFTRELLATAGGFATWARSADDHVLAACAARIQPIMCLELPLTFYRVRPDSVSHADALSTVFLSLMIALRKGAMLPWTEMQPKRMRSGPRRQAADRQPLVSHSLDDLVGGARTPRQCAEGLAFAVLVHASLRDACSRFGRSALLRTRRRLVHKGRRSLVGD